MTRSAVTIACQELIVGLHPDTASANSANPVRVLKGNLRAEAVRHALLKAQRHIAHKPAGIIAGIAELKLHPGVQIDEERLAYPPSVDTI